MPALSVLLPCRDAEAHIADAIASIEAQTFTDFEVIVVDDGSVDATRALLDAWSARDRRVHVIDSPGTGIVAALQSGLRAASAELVARMDADDVAHPRRFRKQLDQLAENRTWAACGARIRYFPRAAIRDGARRYERWINSIVDPADIARDIFVECPIPHPTLMARRAALEAVGGYRDAGWPEDYDLILRLWSAGAVIGKSAEVLLDWRERADRLSRTDPRYAADAFRRCKAHYLRQTLLSTFDRVVVWGAGPVGKAMARQLDAEGVAVAAFVDLDPRKIGQTIHGAPVVAPAAIGRFRGCFAVAAVGSSTARAEIRSSLESAGWTEMEEYCAVA